MGGRAGSRELTRKTVNKRRRWGYWKRGQEMVWSIYGCLLLFVAGGIFGLFWGKRKKRAGGNLDFCVRISHKLFLLDFHLRGLKLTMKARCHEKSALHLRTFIETAYVYVIVITNHRMLVIFFLCRHYHDDHELYVWLWKATWDKIRRGFLLRSHKTCGKNTLEIQKPPVFVPHGLPYMNMSYSVIMQCFMEISVQLSPCTSSF